MLKICLENQVAVGHQGAGFIAPLAEPAPSLDAPLPDDAKDPPG